MNYVNSDTKVYGWIIFMIVGCVGFIAGIEGDRPIATIAFGIGAIVSLVCATLSIKE